MSYEDVQIIVTQLLQCAINILSAINGPLQQRTEVLEKDSTSATEFPNDYDTDLELEWANPNVFAAGDDFSWQMLQKDRILYFQKKLADECIIKFKFESNNFTSSLFFLSSQSYNQWLFMETLKRNQTPIFLDPYHFQFSTKMALKFLFKRVFQLQLNSSFLVILILKFH